MAKPPRRPPPQKRKSDLPAGDPVASRAVVPKKGDPRQAGIRCPAASVRPQLAKLVTVATRFAALGFPRLTAKISDAELHRFIADLGARPLTEGELVAANYLKRHVERVEAEIEIMLGGFAG